ncbi:uncharacterized protein CC84DRAFT_166891 [Paraphaeosphaeria sporulosa]|uniref:Uncharacterized protein n=1 Tax=Paraphaeosphaeria sporulosa TaxID=1460663 RepID=A0A177D1A0_9PLEO|nr:uncharacterized protein CC84DRAFT_166891 [Paraphaeosphaeria sporulosa]OAG12952.1 hypothetical protein CC84DRAFT_166891 [Paraphaeosphaeria sporulosa]
MTGDTIRVTRTHVRVAVGVLDVFSVEMRAVVTMTSSCAHSLHMQGRVACSCADFVRRNNRRTVYSQSNRLLNQSIGNVAGRNDGSRGASVTVDSRSVRARPTGPPFWGTGPGSGGTSFSKVASSNCRPAWATIGTAHQRRAFEMDGRLQIRWQAQPRPRRGRSKAKACL